MPQNQTNSLPLPGSDRNLPPDAQLVGPCSPTALITVTLYLRARNQEELQQRLRQLRQSHSYLTPIAGAAEVAVAALLGFVPANTGHETKKSCNSDFGNSRNRIHT